MSGFTGNDGSELVGGLNPSGVVKALSVDASGNLNVNASVSSGPTNITQVSSTNVGPTNGLPISGNNSGALAVIAVDGSGRLILVPDTAFNMAQIAGVAPGLDNTNELRASIYGKGNGAAGDTALLLDSSGRPIISNIVQIGGVAPLLESQSGISGSFITEDQIRRLTIAGSAYSVTTGKLTAPGAATLGFQVFAPANNTKNILIYSLVLATTNSGVHQIYRTAANVNSITGWTDVAAAASNNGASAVASTAIASYSNTALTGGLLGTAREFYSIATNTTYETLTNGECIWLPAGASGISGVAVYFGIGGANIWGVTCEYLEF